MAWVDATTGGPNVPETIHQPRQACLPRKWSDFINHIDQNLQSYKFKKYNVSLKMELRSLHI